MNDNLTKEYLENFIINFTKTPERFATPLSISELKSFGVNNNEFWKSFIININTLNDVEVFNEKGLHKHLAKIFFLETKNGKFYFIEKLPTKKIAIDAEEIKQIATELKEQGVEVDETSAVYLNREYAHIKFLKYKINRDN